MDDLVTWLLEQVEVDKGAALAASPGPWHANAEHDEVVAEDGITVADGFALSNNQLRATVDHIANWDPKRALAECETKRQIVEACKWETDGDNLGLTSGYKMADRTLRVYGAMYAKLGRDGYRPEWGPDADDD